jgi:hypothetical protein
MHMSSRIGIAMTTATLLLAGTASAGFQGMNIELVAVDAIDQPTGNWTARLYAELDAGSRLDAVYGNAENPLWMGTTGSLFQHQFGGDTTTTINPALYVAFPSLVYDSWVTIGLEDQVGNALSSIGMNFGADSVSTSDGSFYVTPDDAQGQEVEGRVLIGQFTVFGYDAQLYGTISLQGKHADGSNWSEEGVEFHNLIPLPGPLSLLIVGGVVGGSRRRRPA